MNLPDDYHDVMDAIKARYEVRVLAKLTEIREFIEANQGHDCGDVFSIDDEEYDWRFMVEQDTPHAYDVSITQGEAVVFGDEAYGVSWRIDFVGESGRIIGGFAPYNYTSSCWVDAKDPDAVEVRFQAIEAASLHDLPILIENYLIEVDGKCDSCGNSASVLHDDTPGASDDRLCDTCFGIVSPTGDAK